MNTPMLLDTDCMKFYRHCFDKVVDQTKETVSIFDLKRAISNELGNIAEVSLASETTGDIEIKFNDPMQYEYFILKWS